MSLILTSAAFHHQGEIPSRYTCDGDDISPPLAWSDAPEKTKSFALICDDPDAPGNTWVHWAIFNIPPNQMTLPANVPKTDTVAGGIRQGKNDFRKTGYGGPCPPSGKPHRYYFKLYALDTVLGLKPGATKDELLTAMKGHVLAETTLMGKYGR